MVYKFWEWESEEEKHNRDASDFLKRAQELINKSNAESFIRDAGNALGAVGNAAKGSLEGAKDSYFNMARSIGIPEDPASKIGTAASIAEPLIDPSGLVAGTAERLGMPGAQETGMKTKVLDVASNIPGPIGNIASGLKTAKDLGAPVPLDDVEIEHGPRELLSAPFSALNPVGAIAGFAGKFGAKSAIHTGVIAAGKFQKELQNVKTGYDLLDAVEITRPPFPDKALGDIVTKVKTLIDETGGATYGVHTGDKLGSPEFAVGIFPDKSVVIDGKASTTHLSDFIEKNKELLRDPRTNIGAWFDNTSGKTYLDITATFPDEEMAMEVGKHFNQKAIYDLKNQRELFIEGTSAGQKLLTIVHPNTTSGKSHIDPDIDGDSVTKTTKWYVSSEGPDKDVVNNWYKTQIHIGDGGLISTADRAGRSDLELKAAGYKGVYYPNEDEVRLWETVKSEGISSKFPIEIPNISKENLDSGAITTRKLLGLVPTPDSLTLRAIQGGFQGAVGANDPEAEDPISNAIQTIEGAALGASTKILTKNALNIMIDNGASDVMIKNFNRKILEKAPTSIDHEGGVLGLMYNALLSGPATMTGQAVGGMYEVGLRLFRDSIASAYHMRPGDMMGDVFGLQEGLFQGSRAFADGLARLGENGSLGVPTKLIEAFDMWSRATLYGMAVGYNAGKEASKLGLSGTAKYRYIKDALDDPQALGFHDDAFSTALRATYVGETGQLGKKMVDLQQHPMIRFVFPFVGTVHRMAARGVETSPIGLVGTAVDVARGVYDPSKATKFASFGNIDNVTPLNERLGNNIAGTLMYTYFFQQAFSGNITGAGPSDQSQRDALIRQGWQPFSIKVGDNYYDYRKLGPLAQLLAAAALPAEVIQYKKEDENPGDLWQNGVRAFMGLTEEMTYIRGMTDLIRGFQYGKLEGSIDSIARRFVPYGAFLNTIAVGFDPMLRETDSDNWVEGRLNPIKSMVPGLRQQLPTKLDVYGEERTNNKSGVAAIIPSRISPEKINKVDSELSRLDLAAGRIPEELTGPDGEKIPLTVAQKREFQLVAGEGKREALNLLVSSEMYNKADDKEKKKMLSQVIRHASLWGREKIAPETVTDAEFSMYGSDPKAAAKGLISAMETQQKIKQLNAKKYTGKSAEEVEEIDNWKSSLSAFRKAFGNSIGDSAFKERYGFQAYIIAKNKKISDSYRKERSKLVEKNPDYAKFFSGQLDPTEISSAKTLINA